MFYSLAETKSGKTLQTMSSVCSIPFFNAFALLFYCFLYYIDQKNTNLTP